jgi:hypothetical protein
MKHPIVDRLGNTRGVHNDKIADAQPDGLFVWILVFGIAMGLLCKQTPEPKREQLLSMCVMGVCL